MSTILKPPPLSLYIHLPWCIRKCPYCDFNSHEVKSDLPEALYTAALLDEFESRFDLIQGRPITSVFFGGGTPSLFSGKAIDQILSGIHERASLQGAEITLEANPGAADEKRFRDFRIAGINRLSLGIQSLQNDKLKILGRIHDEARAKQAIQSAKQAGFSNFNLDLMFGLPNQTIQDAIHDLEGALQFQPTHLSWYQLTVEPNTVFYKHPPTLPHDDTIWEMQQHGQSFLKQAGFTQYEVSAYAQLNKTCRHNRNYWEFGDYLGIGAGAHSKITTIEDGKVVRFSQIKHPKYYLMAEKRRALTLNMLSESDLVFEFMLNALRLTEGVPAHYFTERTGLPLTRIHNLLESAKKRGLLMLNEKQIATTTLGARFLNEVIEMFLST